MGMSYPYKVVVVTPVDDFSFDDFLLDSDFDVDTCDAFEYKLTFYLEEKSYLPFDL
jgi:hypothetical protein